MRKTYEEWLKEVKSAVAKTGLHFDDLPDCPTKDWFEDRVSPKAAARRLIKNASE